MKKLSIAILLLSACYIMPSCNGDNKSGDTSTSSSDSSTSMSSTSTNDTSTGGMQSSNLKTDSTSNMSTSNMNKTDTLDKDATNFVMKAASGGMMEVELGNVAQQQAKNQRVKDFGSMMVTDHTQANNELKSLASSNNVTVPAALMPAEQMHVNMLKKKTGADFDKAYVSMMIDDHKKDIAEFKKAANSKNADVKNFATKTLPVLQKHLDSIQAIHNSKM